MSKKILLSSVLAVASIVILGSGCDKVREAMKNGAEGDGSASGPVAYLEDATSVPVKFKAFFGGPVRVLKLRVYPKFVNVQIQDPKNPLEVNEYELQDGLIGKPKPVALFRKPSEKDLERMTFDISKVDFTQVPRIAKDALDQLKIDQGRTSLMILERPQPFSKEVIWSVCVDGERRDGSVEYRLDGSFKKIDR